MIKHIVYNKENGEFKKLEQLQWWFWCSNQTRKIISRISTTIDMSCISSIKTFLSLQNLFICSYGSNGWEPVSRFSLWRNHENRDAYVDNNLHIFRKVMDASSQRNMWALGKSMLNGYPTADWFHWFLIFILRRKQKCLTISKSNFQ